MSRRSALGRARGLGSSRDGLHHWWTERLSALALVPLTVWFVASVVAMAGADYYAMRDWLGNPVVSGLLILLLVATFYHGALAAQVVIEDYLHKEWVKLFALLATKAAAVLLGLTGVLAVLVVLFKG
ncbi:MAG TPA: succinate dehydrogenase, hydrophobic membrane anchor protein [Kiloniellales bacterium]|jgi:succinate dehydrogenase / fumarate reductase membrane anchor subunit